jgi:hypothetical protein
MLAALLVALLPLHLDLPAPFPRVTEITPEIERVAPDVEYGEYDLQTDAGPIVVHVVAIPPHTPNITFNSVLASDALTSQGETLSSMAQRTNAIAGINADYFDIGNTNRPTNVVVQNGTLLQSPRKRYALLVSRDGTASIAEASFIGTLQMPGKQAELDGLNVMPPPNGGISLLTPAYGSVAPQENVTLVGVVPTDGTPPFATYRVTTVFDNAVLQPPGYYIAIGLNAYGTAGVPNAGDAITASGDLAPVGLADLAAAVGGGPLLLDNGAYVTDPDGPNGGEYAQRIPCSGAAIAPDGTLFLIEVDGREPGLSVGVTRPEFAVLMRSLGAMRGMAFDGGGSSELVARRPGERTATTVNVPSDGHERKVADGIFVYDTAPVGPATQLLAQPDAVRALPGASVALRLAPADDNDNVVATAATLDAHVEPSSLGTYRDGVFAALHAGDGAIVARAGAIVTRIPVEVTEQPARLVVYPQDPNVAQGGTLTLQARAFDAQGYPIALPPALPWRAQGATIDAAGVLHAGKSDAIVSLLLGDRLANLAVAVGYHDEALPVTPAFMTAPRNGEGSVDAGDSDCPGCMRLHYALGDTERAAYLVTEVPLPQRSVAVSFDVYDDGQGAILKLALRNAINEEVLLTVGPMDHPGWRRVTARLPAGIAEPARLVAIYAIGADATATISGTISVKNLHAVVAGAAEQRP